MAYVDLYYVRRGILRVNFYLREKSRLGGMKDKKISRSHHASQGKVIKKNIDSNVRKDNTKKRHIEKYGTE